jgi:predicted RNA-binding protein with PIN domain
MWLAIDGYNLIAALTGEPLERLDLEYEREELNRLLIDYRGVSRHRVSVVYDGGGLAHGGSRKSREQGLEIVFSPLDRKADQVLIEMARRYGSGLTVVTSDREVERLCEGSGAVVLAADQFWQRLQITVFAGDTGDEDGENRLDRRHLTRKKGNPRRRGKRERRRDRRLNSL